MKIPKAVIFLCVFFIFIQFPCFASAEKWICVETSKDGTSFYYNKDSVCLIDIYDLDNTGVMVRTKEVLSESASNDTMKILRYVLQNDAVVDSDITTLQFNLHNQYRILDMFYFDAQGKLLCYVPPLPLNEWKNIPDSHSFFKLYRRVLEQILADPDFYRHFQKWYNTTDGKFYWPE